MRIIVLKPFEFTGTVFKNLKMDDVGILAEDIPLLFIKLRTFLKDIIKLWESE